MDWSDSPIQAVIDDDDRSKILARYLALEITAEQAVDLLGQRVAVAEVILETRARFGRLPDRDDDFTRGELERALKMLGLKSRDAA